MASTRKPPPAIVFWILWLALLGSIAVYPVVLGGALPHGPNPGVQAWNLPVVWGAILLGAATAIRWIVIPRVTDRVRLLPWMIAGMALSETVTFFGIFLIGPHMPRTQLDFFVLSFLCALQFAPFYATGLLSSPQ